MADEEDYYDIQVAVDGSTGVILQGAEATLYATTDTSRTTPLVVTDMAGVPLEGNVITSTSYGTYPQFKVASGETRVDAVSGGYTTRLVSMLGNRGADGSPGVSIVDADASSGNLLVTLSDGSVIDAGPVKGADGAGLPDASGLPDGKTLGTSGGSWIVVTAPSSGREIRLQATSSAIQWQYVGDSAWTVLVNLADLKGTDGAAGAPGTPGQSPQMRVSGGYLQWKLTGDATWQNLIAISDIGGGNGQFRYLVSGAWQARGSSTYPVWWDAGSATSPPKPTDIQVGDHTVTVNPVSWT